MALLNLTDTYPNGYVPTIGEWRGIFSDINDSVNDIAYTQVSTTLAVDEDNMVSNSATKLPTQQSTKAYVDNTVSNLQISVDSYRIIAGYDDIWGTPGFVVSGTANDVVVKASAADSLQLYINGTLLAITADTAVPSFTLASAGVSASISAAIYTSLQYTRTETEFGDTGIMIDGYASAWTATNFIDRIQAFKTGTEYFLAKPSKKSSATEMSLSRGLRGIGNSSRATLADNDVVYLKQINVLFCGSDKTMYVSPQYPLYQATAPATATTNEFYKNTSDNKWYRYIAATWSQVDAIPLAIVVCDESTVVAIEHFDFDKAWIDTNLSNLYPLINGTSAISAISACSSIAIEIGDLNVAGTKVFLPNPTKIVPSAYLLSSETWASATLYYQYVSPLGEFKVSSACPRDKKTYTGKRKGYYHPKYYWRCIGTVYNDSGSNIIPFFHDDMGNYQYYPNGSGAADSAFTAIMPNTATLTTGFVLYPFTAIPPMCKIFKANVGHGVSGEGAGFCYIYIKPRINTYGMANITDDYSSIDATARVNQDILIENTTLIAREARDLASKGFISVMGFSLKL